MKQLITHILIPFQSRSGAWHWSLRNKRNSLIQADGSEGYTRRTDVVRAMASLPLDWKRIRVHVEDTRHARRFEELGAQVFRSHVS